MRLLQNRRIAQLELHRCGFLEHGAVAIDDGGAELMTLIGGWQLVAPEFRRDHEFGRRETPANRLAIDAHRESMPVTQAQGWLDRKADFKHCAIGNDAAVVFGKTMARLR